MWQHRLFLLVTLLCAVAGPVWCDGISHEPLVEACCCPKSQVDATFEEMLEVLNNLVKRPYFRYYKANLEKACPYWAVELMCGMTDDGKPAPCHVCTCDENDVPMKVREEPECGEYSQSLDDASAENMVPINVDRTVPHSIRQWTDSAAMWFNTYTNDPDAVYIDLALNPEANTGYVGDGARRVWGAIYSENCFQGPLEKLCTAERSFFRLLSGLHVSISAQISANFYPRPMPPDSPPDAFAWDPNLEMFMRTVGNWPDRVDNLYFLYMFVLRALSKAKPTLQLLDYSTGDVSEDALTKAEVDRLLDARLVCTETFNETLMFQGSSNKAEILSQMRSKFFNISLLMDCLSCEKCRLWGKVETHGLATALKIVVEDVPMTGMQRSEIVALVQLLRQLSSSLSSVQRLLALHQALKERENEGSCEDSNGRSASDNTGKTLKQGS